MTGVSSIAVVASYCSPALASDGDTKAEIRALKAQLRKLEHRLDEQERAPRVVRAHGPAGSNAMVIKGEQPEGYPDRFYYKGITLTPGGFFAMETVYRSRWMGSDVSTGFQNIPFGNSAAGHTSEIRFSARQSQFSMRIDGDVNPSTHLGAYIEVDFLGAAQTANSNQTNSYNPRMRQIYSTVDLNQYGLHFLAGQTWTLATLNSAGIRPDTHLRPSTIDAQYVPGFVFTRQPQLRVEKDLAYNLSAAFSAEGAATTYGAVGVLPGAPFAIPGATTSVAGIGTVASVAPLTSAAGASGGLFNSANSYSFNSIPDMIGKVAWDPTFMDRHIHVEGFGILREFIDREYWGNHSVWGGGGGFGVVIPIVPKLFDVQVSGLEGTGVGRYGAAGLNDATTSVTGAPLPIQQRMLLVGGTVHATPQTDLYVYAGGEFAASQPQFVVVPGKTPLIVGGYGNPFFDNSACDLDSGSGPLVAGLGTNCSNQTKSVRQLTGGIWHTIYQGAFGKFKVGAQYSYTQRDLFPGFGATPKGVENMVYTSIRYYPF
jgi:hypothetical protein